MRVLVVGASGLIGSAVVAALGEHEVVTASRSDATHPVDITDPESVTALFAGVGELDAVVCTAGSAPFAPWPDAGEEAWQAGLNDKLLGQVRVVRAAADRVRSGGHITVTSGVLARHPMPGSSILSGVNGALEAFVRAAAVELPELRINVVSPGWVSETLAAMGRDPATGTPAAQVAEAYVGLLGGDETGTVVSPVH